jgi:hypothetical protein
MTIAPRRCTNRFNNTNRNRLGFELRTGSREPMAACMFALLCESYTHGKSPAGRKIARVIQS